MSRDGAIALRRFGLGARPGEIARIAGDPRGFVAAQLKASAVLARAELEPSHVIHAKVQDALVAQRLAAAMAKQDQMAGTADAPPSAPKVAGGLRREFYREEAVARIETALTTPTPLLERLAWFWSNHFAVSIAKGPVRPIVGAFEREAIRPHVLGRFSDMLVAVERHPAMLIYLDNQLSIGPNSIAGRNRDKGLNENLAREILELHTLGVAGGYTQSDVTNLAKVLTGWTVGGIGGEIGEPGKFAFTPRRHEAGRITVVGKSYGDSGEAAGLDALRDLARHPSTAKHVTGKLARHFVGDAAPPALLTKLEKSFRDSDGDLGIVTRALVTAPEAWSAPQKKIVPPLDLVVSIARGLEIKIPPGEVMRLAAVLGQTIWMPPSPKGFADTDDAWTGPSAVRERLRIAEKASREVAKAIDPREAAADLLGGVLTAASREAIARAETREQGLELMMMSPEFQRR